MSTTPTQRTALALAAAALATLALYYVPGLESAAWPLMLFSTLVHELGHGLAALVLGGELLSVSLWPDGSGVAQHRGAYSGLVVAMIAAAGLIGPALAAFVLLLCGRSALASRAALCLVAVVLMLVGVLLAGSAFSLAVCLAFAAVAGLLGWRGNDHWVQIAILFMALQMSFAVFSRGDYLFTDSAETGAGRMPSDVAAIAEALWLPYWIWGGLIAVFSVGLLIAGAALLLRRLR